MIEKIGVFFLWIALIWGLYGGLAKTDLWETYFARSVSNVQIDVHLLQE